MDTIGCFSLYSSAYLIAMGHELWEVHIGALPLIVTQILAAVYWVLLVALVTYALTSAYYSGRRNDQTT